MFLTALVATVLTAVVVNAIVSHEFAQVMDDVGGYLALSATEKGDDVGEDIKDNLVLSSYKKEQWKYVQMIKNTSGICCVYSGAVVKTNIQTFYNEPTYVDKL